MGAIFLFFNPDVFTFLGTCCSPNLLGTPPPRQFSASLATISFFSPISACDREMEIVFMSPNQKGLSRETRVETAVGGLKDIVPRVEGMVLESQKLVLVVFPRFFLYIV